MPRADIVNGNAVGGLSEQDAKILHAQPLLFDPNQRLDVASLRGRICGVLLDLGPNELCFVRVAAQGGHCGGGEEDRLHGSYIAYGNIIFNGYKR
jgi:hypothetical protein